MIAVLCTIACLKFKSIASNGHIGFLNRFLAVMYSIAVIVDIVIFEANTGC